MRIAVVNEVSACHRNRDIIGALRELGYEPLNLGMSDPAQKPELTYLHTGLMSALALQLGIADIVVGGCGTGQGYLNAVMQYPGVVCGLLTEPLDAWLFCRINGGNCVSLALNKGYGWASERNLVMLFDALLSAHGEAGYPASRVESQTQSRERLNAISRAAHPAMDRILSSLEPWLVNPVFGFEPFRQALSLGAEGRLLTQCLALADAAQE